MALGDEENCSSLRKKISANDSLQVQVLDG
jgi:hypothetical protein